MAIPVSRMRQGAIELDAEPFARVEVVLARMIHDASAARADTRL